MDSSAPTPRISAHGKPLGFFKNVMKRKQSFFQFFTMTGVLFLSFRPLGQKYHLHNLNEDIATLKEEQENISSRKDRIKQSLLDEAKRESTGAFAARLRVLFGEESN